MFFSPSSHRQKVLAVPRDFNPFVILMGTVTDRGSTQREGAAPHTYPHTASADKEKQTNTKKKATNRRNVSGFEAAWAAATFWHITSPGALSSANLRWLFALPLPSLLNRVFSCVIAVVALSCSDELTAAGPAHQA